MTRRALLEVAILRIVLRHEIEHRLRLVELAAALVIERQVVEIVHQLRVYRTLLELLEGQIELALSLVGKRKDAVARGRGIGCFCGTLIRHGGSPLSQTRQRMSGDEQAHGGGKRYPKQEGGHQQHLHADQRSHRKCGDQQRTPLRQAR